MISHYFDQKKPGVFHAKSWNTFVSDENISELFEVASQNYNKARLCLHPTTEEINQVTYLAFIKPYKDKIHQHPYRSEVLVALIGEAYHHTYDLDGNLKSTRHLLGIKRNTVSISKNILHNLEIISDQFLMLEIGSGPFLSNSTVFYAKEGTVDKK